ncbi:MAG: tetratricopeptide repeat protein [Syntrophales bacterium]|jgi:tetratricopeptide (TPR) repeat protein|nr:tetratricopeptide repeat protein [Syntrophales bacterium]
MAGAHLKTGMANLESGHYIEALKELFEARNLDPDNPQVYYYSGVAYYGRGLKKEAAQEFHKACTLDQKYSEAYNFLGLICFEEEHYDEAIGNFTKALSNVFYETPEFALNNLGKAYLKKGNYAMALSRFDEALKIRPNKILPIIYMNKGALFLAMNRPAEAVRNLEKSIELAPYITESHYLLGCAHLLNGNRTHAVKELKTARMLGPQSEFGLKAKKILGEK